VNTPTILVSAVLAAAATAGGLVIFLQRPASLPPAAEAPSQADFEARIVGVEEKLAELTRRLEQFSAEIAKGNRMAVDPIRQADLEAAVAQVLERRAAESTVEAAHTGSLRKEEAIAQLAEAGGNFNEIEEVWSAIEKAGIEEEVLAHFKARAEAAPDDAHAQYRYGAYLIAGIESKPMAKQGQLAMLADKQFDRTLAIDDKHWAARFMKATSLSFWPKITGKHAEALRHFEILADQQEQVAPQPHFAETYLFLGNMHLENGDRDKARAAYERGLRWFPDREDLERQLATIGK